MTSSSVAVLRPIAPAICHGLHHSVHNVDPHPRARTQVHLFAFDLHKDRIEIGEGLPANTMLAIRWGILTGARDDQGQLRGGHMLRSPFVREGPGRDRPRPSSHVGSPVILTVITPRPPARRSGCRTRTGAAGSGTSRLPWTSSPLPTFRFGAQSRGGQAGLRRARRQAGRGRGLACRAPDGGRTTDPVGAAPSFDPAEVGLQALESRLRQTPFDAPERPDLEGCLGNRELAVADRVGRVLLLADDVVLPVTPALAMRVLVTLSQPFTTRKAKQALTTTRRVALPLLEHLDARGSWSRRLNGVHWEVRNAPVRTCQPKGCIGIGTASIYRARRPG